MRSHIIALVVALTANAAGNIMIRAGMRSRTDVHGPAGLVQAVLSSPLVWGGIVLFAFNVLCYAYALTRIPLSTAYPLIVAGGLLIVLLASALLLREPVSLTLAAGATLITAGVVLVARAMG